MACRPQPLVFLITLEIVETRADGNLAYLLSTWTVKQVKKGDYPSNSEESALQGHTLRVLLKQSDGTWKTKVQMFVPLTLGALWLREATGELFDTVSKGDRAQSPASAILICRGWRPMMAKRAAETEDRRIVAKRIFDALCAAYSDKYITLIQPREADAPLPDITA